MVMMFYPNLTIASGGRNKRVCMQQPDLKVRLGEWKRRSRLKALGRIGAAEGSWTSTALRGLYVPWTRQPRMRLRLISWPLLLHGPFTEPNLEAAAQENSNFKYDAIPIPSQVAGGPYSCYLQQLNGLGVVEQPETGDADAARFPDDITDTEQTIRDVLPRGICYDIANNDAMDPEIADGPESPLFVKA